MTSFLAPQVVNFQLQFKGARKNISNLIHNLENTSCFRQKWKLFVGKGGRAED